jgi:hypothetical protein
LVKGRHGWGDEPILIQGPDDGCLGIGWRDGSDGCVLSNEVSSYSCSYGYRDWATASRVQEDLILDSSEVDRDELASCCVRKGEFDRGSLNCTADSWGCASDGPCKVQACREGDEHLICGSNNVGPWQGLEIQLEDCRGSIDSAGSNSSGDRSTSKGIRIKEQRSICNPFIHLEPIKRGHC